MIEQPTAGGDGTSERSTQRRRDLLPFPAPEIHTALALFRKSAWSFEVSREDMACLVFWLLVVALNCEYNGVQGRRFAITGGVASEAQLQTLQGLRADVRLFLDRADRRIEYRDCMSFDRL